MEFVYGACAAAVFIVLLNGITEATKNWTKYDKNQKVVGILILLFLCTFVVILSLVGLKIG